MHYEHHPGQACVCVLIFKKDVKMCQKPPAAFYPPFVWKVEFQPQRILVMHDSNKVIEERDHILEVPCFMLK